MISRSWIPTWDEYLTDPSWSSSNLVAARDSIADALHQKANPSPSTPAQLIGSYVHAILLRDEEAVKRLRVAHDGVSRRKRKAWAELAAKAAGDLLTFDEGERARQIIASVGIGQFPGAPKTRRQAWQLLAGLPGHSEVSHRWEYVYANGEPSGVMCRIRADRLPHLNGRWVHVSLKTTRQVPSPLSWRRERRRWGYVIGETLYRQGLGDLLGQQPATVNVVCQAGGAYSVGVYSISDSDLDDARELLDGIVRDVADAQQTGRWLSPWELDGIREI